MWARRAAAYMHRFHSGQMRRKGNTKYSSPCVPIGDFRQAKKKTMRELRFVSLLLDDNRMYSYQAHAYTHAYHHIWGYNLEYN